MATPRKPSVKRHRAATTKTTNKTTSDPNAFTLYYYDPRTGVRSDPIGTASTLLKAKQLVQRSFKPRLGPAGPARIQIVNRNGQVVAMFAVSGEQTNG